MLGFYFLLLKIIGALKKKNCVRREAYFIWLLQNTSWLHDSDHALQWWKDRSFKNESWVCVFAFLSVFNWAVHLSSTKKSEWISLMKLSSRESMLFKFYYFWGQPRKHLIFGFRCLFPLIVCILNIIFMQAVFIHIGYLQAIQERWHKKWPKLEKKKKKGKY